MKVERPIQTGKKRVITLACKCVLENREKEEQEARKQDMIRTLHRRGFESGKYADMTLSRWRKRNNGDNIFEMAVNYINSVDCNGRNWVYLHGDCGLGKTHIAVASTRRIALDRYWGPAFFRWTQYCRQIQQSWQDKSVKIDWSLIRGARILVLDDIDKKPATQWSLGELYDILDDRDINRLPTIITANRSIQALSTFWSKTEETGSLSKAIISRIVGQLAKVIHLMGKDYRFERD